MSGNEEDNDDIPDRDTCQLRCEQFAVLTGTDTACAQFYLQDRKWDLEVEGLSLTPLQRKMFTHAGGTSTNNFSNYKCRGVVAGAALGSASGSVNAYFDANNNTEAGVQVLEDGDEPQYVVRFESLAAAIAAATGAQDQPDKLKFITWNVDGLDDVTLKKRTKSVCNTINCELPDIVYLQEVVPQTVAYYEKYLPAYKCIKGGDEGYFTVTMLRTNSITVKSHKIIPFPSSVMERNMLIVEANVGKIPLVLINSHLESTKDHSRERIKQLKTAFQYTLGLQDNQTVIFGGDLNLRDKELQEAGGIPAGLEDLWISCGSRPECRYTWDATRNDNTQIPGRFKPRCRFDRVYIRHASPGSILPKHFGLIGLERLKSCRRFPSDHWGIVVYFDVDKANLS